MGACNGAAMPEILSSSRALWRSTCCRDSSSSEWNEQERARPGQATHFDRYYLAKTAIDPVTALSILPV